MPLLVSLAALDALAILRSPPSARDTWDAHLASLDADEESSPPDTLHSPDHSSRSAHRGILTIARRGDACDKANERSVVRPLPKGVHRAHRLVATLVLIIVVALVVGSVSASLFCIDEGANLC